MHKKLTYDVATKLGVNDKRHLYERSNSHDGHAFHKETEGVTMCAYQLGLRAKGLMYSRNTCGNLYTLSHVFAWQAKSGWYS